MSYNQTEAGWRLSDSYNSQLVSYSGIIRRKSLDRLQRPPWMLCYVVMSVLTATRHKPVERRRWRSAARKSSDHRQSSSSVLSTWCCWMLMAVGESAAFNRALFTYNLQTGLLAYILAQCTREWDWRGNSGSGMYTYVWTYTVAEP